MDFWPLAGQLCVVGAILEFGNAHGGWPLSGDVVSLTADVMPYVSAAVAAYGGAVLARVRDDAADATAGLGRRMLQRIFGSRKGSERLPDPLADLAANPDDEDALAAVRLAIRKVLAADPEESRLQATPTDGERIVRKAFSNVGSVCLRDGMQKVMTPSTTAAGRRGLGNGAARLADPP